MDDKMDITIKRIKQKLEKVRTLDKDFELFGAGLSHIGGYLSSSTFFSYLNIRHDPLDPFQNWGHCYILNPPAREEYIERFEKKYKIKLPTEYRAFIKYIGNGGAGPHLGLYSLRDLENGLVNNSLDDLSKEFPAMKVEPLEDYDNDEELFRPELTQGTLILTAEGSGYYDLLAITGPKKGTVWFDGRSSDEGFDQIFESFFRWYEFWLDSSIDKIGKGGDELIKLSREFTKETPKNKAINLFIESNQQETIQELEKVVGNSIYMAEKIEPEEYLDETIPFLKKGLPYGYAVSEGNVVFLSIFDQGINKIPDPVYKLKKLEILGLVGNNLTHLPSKLATLKDLNTLALGCNNIEIIEDSISDFQPLEVLNLYNNKLKSISEKIGDLGNLRELYLTSNEPLKTIPDSLMNLKKLEVLQLNNTSISELPEEISDLPSLQRLYIANTNVSDLPTSITELEQLLVVGIDVSKVYPESIEEIFEELRAKNVEVIGI
ncbi:MAG: leucine-rich repeat domain-containing protein [Promethearchaeota archaeon]|jgi:Leucine-rich repeat (LRR) protein